MKEVDPGSLKRTPLNAVHRRMGARMVPFGGWDMPVQYSGILEEHRAVRGAAGLFDISHMGEIEFRGPGALAAVQRLVTNDASRLQVGQVQYAALCYDSGTFVDDLTVYKLADDHYMFTVNASNIDKDYEWIRDHVTGGVEVRNISDETALLALQGPQAPKILQKLTSVDLSRIKYYWFQPGKVLDAQALISRTGYTGEDGFELKRTQLVVAPVAADRVEDAALGVDGRGHRGTMLQTKTPGAARALVRIWGTPVTSSAAGWPGRCCRRGRGCGRGRWKSTDRRRPR